MHQRRYVSRKSRDGEVKGPRIQTPQFLTLALRDITNVTHRLSFAGPPSTLLSSVKQVLAQCTECSHSANTPKCIRNFPIRIYCPCRSIVIFVVPYLLILSVVETLWRCCPDMGAIEDRQRLRVLNGPLSSSSSSTNGIPASVLRSHKLALKAHVAHPQLFISFLTSRYAARG